MNRVPNRKWKRLQPGTRLWRESRPWADSETGEAGVRTRYGRTRNAAEKRGERVVAVRLHGSPYVNLRHCRGDDHRTEFILWDSGTYEMDDPSVEAWALERLTNGEPVVAWCAHCGRPMQAGDMMCCPHPTPDHA